jgi:hypothetical protein
MYIVKVARVRGIYQRGPRGGGMSKAINPLRQTCAMPSPVFKIY